MSCPDRLALYIENVLHLLDYSYCNRFESDLPERAGCDDSLSNEGIRFFNFVGCKRGAQ